jgi:hypothetical protein
MNRAELFLDDLRKLYDRHGLVIDSHVEFVSLLRDQQTNDVIAILYGDSLDYEVFNE